MLDGREDQAAGLRRLFRRTPPQVVALYACGRHRTHNAVLTAHRLAGHAERVLILDEGEGEAGLGATLGLEPGRDLLQVLDGRTTLADVLQPARGLLGRVPTVAAALTLPLLDDARRACVIEALRILHRHASIVLVHADGERAAEPSPFVNAAPRRLLVAEASASGATEAYRTIKALAAAGAGSVHVAVCRARGKADAAAFFASLEALVRRHVGLPLVWLGEIERDDLLGGLTQASVPPTTRAASAAFMRRINGLSRSAGGPRA